MSVITGPGMYRSRGGKKRTIKHNAPNRPWRCVETQYTYGGDGAAFPGACEDPGDIVGPWEEPEENVEIPEVKWFKGDDGKKPEGIAFVACAPEDLHNPRNWIQSSSYGTFSKRLYYARIPEIADPDPEPVQVKGCEPPSIQHLAYGFWNVKATPRGDYTALSALHEDKAVAIRAYNAAARVLNGEGE